MTHTSEFASRDRWATGLRLRALLRELSDQDRFLLECRIVDGWDYAEIAARVGVPHPTLVQRVQEIRTELRRRAKTVVPTTQGKSLTVFDPSVPTFVAVPACHCPLRQGI